MPDKREKVIEILAQYGENSMVKLVELTGIRRNDLFELIPKMKSEELVKIRSEGREKLVRLFSPKKSIDYFIENYPKRLKYFEKLIETELKALEKNKPLISKTDFPFIKVKIKRGVLELDKERNVKRDMGKTEDDYVYKFKTRPTARKHFDNIMVLLNKLYQESSVLNFNDPVIDNYKLLKNYQKRSEKLIKKTRKNIEDMFYDKQDPKALTFVVWQMRNVLYGIFYKEILELEMEKT